MGSRLLERPRKTLQRLLGGAPGLDGVLAGLSSDDPLKRDEAISALARATSAERRNTDPTEFRPASQATATDGWSADNFLTRAVNERRQATNNGPDVSQNRPFVLPASLDW